MRGMRLGLVGLILAIGSNPIVAEDDSPSKKPFRMVLFDGKTLEGWKKAETYKAGGVKVEDGVIVIEAGGPMTAITSTRTDLPTTATSSRRRRSRSASHSLHSSTVAGAGA
jgi:hypothetical protein